MFRAVRGPLLIIVLIALLLAGLWFWIRTSLPDLSGSQAMPGLARVVEITRDRHGIPRIEADSQEDLYYALGFVHAQDRLWQMEYRRLQAAGRLAELLGDDALRSDLLIRTFGLRQAAERDVALLSARARGALQAYCDGINAFLERRTGALPLEFQLLGHGPESWSPADVALLQKLTSWGWARPVESELLHARLAERLSRDELRELLDGETPPVSTGLYRQVPLAELGELLARGDVAGDGSRAWALGAERSANGAPLLAFEGYGPLSAPAPWYLVELRAPGLTAVGATLPGMPLLLSGRNERVAWALIPTPADTQDLYLERVESSADGSGVYLTDDGPRELQTRRVSVQVRGGEEVLFNVRRTRHGPIVSDLVDFAGVVEGAEELAVALRWTALEQGDRTLQGALDLVSAGSWADMRAAARLLDEFHGTLLYADDQGLIAEQQVGRLPERGSASGSFPLPAWSSASGWSGWIPFVRLDSDLSPAEGVIVVAEAGEETTERLLASLDTHTVESSAALLGRQYLASAVQLLPVARSAVPSGELERRAHAQLLGWGGEIEAESAAPLIFSAWYSAFAQVLLGDELGDDLAEASLRQPVLLQRAVESDGWCDDGRSDEVEECADMSSLALSNAVAAIVVEYGPQIDEWPAHERARASYRHPVFDETVLAPLFRVTPSANEERAGDQAAVGPTYRAVYELRAPRDAEGIDWGNSGFLIPTGASGNPLSPYYRNLADRWRDVELLTPGRAEGDEVEQLVLEPRR